jgi:hypothetical protein
LETRSVAETAFLADHTFLYKTSFWQNIAMTSPETSYMKNVTNKLSFLLITHMTHFNIRFGRYGILNSYFSSGQVGLQVFGQVSGPQNGGSKYHF